MKKLLIPIIAISIASCSQPSTTIKGNSDKITYIGRTLRDNPETPRQWAAGAYYTFGFSDDLCLLYITNEYTSERNNILEIAIDDLPSQKIRTNSKHNTIVVGKAQHCNDSIANPLYVYQDLQAGYHHITVCRNSETAMGYTQLDSVKAKTIGKWTSGDKLKIEFIGNSITCGAEADTADTPQKDYIWGDWHRAYMSYGAQTARMLQAQYSLVSVSGIGLIHSCCDMEITMPQVYNKYILRNNEITYDFKDFRPDIICSCLGQNDGIQDSAKFCDTYTEFIRQVSARNPSARYFVLLTSPMADQQLKEWLEKMLKSIAKRLNDNGIPNVTCFTFSKSWNSGGASHPSVEEHTQIAEELTAHIKTLL